MTSGRSYLLGGIVFVAVWVLVALVIFRSSDDGPGAADAAYAVPYRPSMTADQVNRGHEIVTPALLYEVYRAFELVQEDEIYDTLATVTSGEALEFLYLERVGAMAGGGLDEADQAIHEINLVEASSERDGTTLRIAATWQVIGTVGHAEHLHVRGNTYSADLVVTPSDGAWKIAEFELLEVNRDAAGETFLAPDAEEPADG